MYKANVKIAERADRRRAAYNIPTRNFVADFRSGGVFTFIRALPV